MYNLKKYLKVKSKKKAQISIEFIILIAIFLMFFYSMILPTINFSENVIKDTYQLVQTKKATTKLARTIEEYSNTPGTGKRSIFLYLPDNSYITGCDTTVNPAIIMTKSKLAKSPGIYFCDNTGLCDINVSVYTNLNLSCESLASGYRGEIIINKDTGDINYETP